MTNIDAAWARAEAALPAHWRLGISPHYPSGWEAYAYDIRGVPTSANSVMSSRSGASTGACFGDSPAKALNALAETLRPR